MEHCASDLRGAAVSVRGNSAAASLANLLGGTWHSHPCPDSSLPVRFPVVAVQLNWFGSCMPSTSCFQMRRFPLSCSSQWIFIVFANKRHNKDGALLFCRWCGTVTLQLPVCSSSTRNWLSGSIMKLFHSSWAARRPAPGSAQTQGGECLLGWLGSPQPCPPRTEMSSLQRSAAGFCSFFINRKT